MVDGEADKEFPKIRALGPLFRNTEVFLWDDAGVITSGISTHNGYLSLEPAASSSFQTRKLNSCTTTEEESSTDHTITGRLPLCGRAGVGSTDGCLGASTLLWYEQSEEQCNCNI